MKKILLILSTLLFMIGCTEQPYYEIPLDENGNVLLTGVSSATTTGISSLDDEFSVTAQFATAKSGDVMHVELLKLQIPPNGGTTKQLLPLEGTQKDVTVGSDLKSTVTYTRAEAQMENEGDYVTVVFNGKTDYAKQRVDMEYATSTTKPMVGDVVVDVARTSEVAYFNVEVNPKSSSYSGNLIAKRKNGSNANWVDVEGSPFSGNQPFLVPISGDDFEVGKDTMIYLFSSSMGSYTDQITTTIIVRDPYLYFKRSAILIMGGAKAGRNLLTNEGVPADDPNAMVAVSGSLVLKGGSAYIADGKTIQFVEGTAELYDVNNATKIKAAFNAGSPSDTADPISGSGYFIFKAVIGTSTADVFYGMIKVTNVTPGTSLSFEYKIGDQYAHLEVIK